MHMQLHLFMYRAVGDYGTIWIFFTLETLQYVTLCLLTGSARTGFEKIVKKVPIYFLLLDEYACDFRNSFCIVIPGLVSSIEVLRINIDPTNPEK